MPSWFGETLGVALRLAIIAAIAAAFTTFFAPSGRAAGSDQFFGMVVGPQVDAGKAIGKLGDLRVNTVRLRMDVKDWARPDVNTGSKVYDGALDQAGPLHDKGFRTVLQVNSEGGAMPSYARAKALFSWLLKRPGADKVDVFEIFGPLNEQVSNADAFSTTLSRADQARRYVRGPLKAAWDVFHPANRKVLGGPFSLVQQRADFSRASATTLDLAKIYVHEGYLKYADYAGLQPYASTAKGQVDWARRAVKVFGDTPIWISEWGLIRNAFPDSSAYTEAMNTAKTGLKSTIAVSCYAGFTETDGADGVVPPGFGGYRATQPAYDTYRGWTH